MLLSVFLVAVFSRLVAVTAGSLNLEGLSPLLSSAATISPGNNLPRWSDYDKPTPGAIVNVATEDDVAVTVRRSNFLLQAA